MIASIIIAMYFIIGALYCKQVILKELEERIYRYENNMDDDEEFVSQMRELEETNRIFGPRFSTSIFIIVGLLFWLPCVVLDLIRKIK